MNYTNHDIYSPHCGWLTIQGYELYYSGTCKEEYINDVAYDEIPNKVAITAQNKKQDQSLSIIESFCKEFKLPMPKAVWGANFCVLTVPKRWAKNTVTFGLLLELLRADIDNNKKATFRSVASLNWLKKASPQKIKALWHENFDAITNWTQDSKGNYNCYYFLNQVCIQDLVADFNFDIDEEAVALMSWLIKFNKL